jgi:hypothetical protein
MVISLIACKLKLIMSGRKSLMTIIVGKIADYG